MLQVCTILKIKLERWNFLNQLSLPGVVRKKYVSFIIHVNKTVGGDQIRTQVSLINPLHVFNFPNNASLV